MSLRPRLQGCIFKSFHFHTIAFSIRSTLDCVFILASSSFWPLLIIESVARLSQYVLFTHDLLVKQTEGKNQTLVGAIPFCGEYPGPRFEDKFWLANQIDGISIADGGKMADS